MHCVCNTQEKNQDFMESETTAVTPHILSWESDAHVITRVDKTKYALLN